LPSAFIETETPVAVTTNNNWTQILTLSIVLSEAVEIFATSSFEVSTQSGGSFSTIEITLEIDGTIHAGHSRYLSETTDRGIGAVTHRSDELAAGTYTIRLLARRTSGTSVPGLNNANLLVMAMQGAKGEGSVTASNLAAATHGSTAKTPIVDADEIAITDSDASFSGKKVTFTTVWTWIKAKLDAGLIVAGAWAFTSTTRPTSSGTGTPASTSLMTRSDVDLRRITGGVIDINLDTTSGWASLTSGGGTSLSYLPTGVSLQSASTSAFGTLSAYLNTGNTLSVSKVGIGGSGAGIDWAMPFSLHFSLHSGVSGYNDPSICMFYALIGNQTAASTFAALTPTNKTYLGVYTDTNGYLFLVVCNGTTKVSSAGSYRILGPGTTNQRRRTHIAVYNQGNGSASLYVDGVFVESVSGLPTTSVIGVDVFFGAESTASPPVLSHRFIFQSPTITF